MSEAGTKTSDDGKQNGKSADQGKEPCSEPIMQQPGDVIVPEVADGLVEKIAEELYGLKVEKCKQLNGYDDKNYHIRVLPETTNPHVTSICPDGYVMKIVNTMDTQRPAILYAQIAFMQHLHSHGIATQDAVPSVTGEQVVFYQFPPPSGEGETKTHAVGLRTFIPGTILYEVTLTQDLCYKIGQFMGSMTKALEDFHHPFYDTFDCLWSLVNLPKVSDFVHVITDVKDRRVVDEVIAEFSSKVLPRRSELRKGYIHGDPNEQNILVKREGDGTGDDTPYVIAGILDFQDATYTHPLFDLALNVAYVMLQATTFDPLEVGGHILAGYTTLVDLPDLERALLRAAVAGRLVQSLVLGAYNYSLDPTNGYLLTTARRGWHVLHVLWETPSEALYEMWDQIQQSYKR